MPVAHICLTYARMWWSSAAVNHSYIASDTRVEVASVSASPATCWMRRAAARRCFVSFCRANQECDVCSEKCVRLCPPPPTPRPPCNRADMQARKMFVWVHACKNTKSLPPGSLQVFKSFPGQPHAPWSASLFLPLPSIPPHFAYAWFSILLSISISRSLFTLSLFALHTDLLSLPTSPDQWAAGRSRQSSASEPPPPPALRACVCTFHCEEASNPHSTLQSSQPPQCLISWPLHTPTHQSCACVCTPTRTKSKNPHFRVTWSWFFFPFCVCVCVFSGELRTLISILPARKDSCLTYLWR